MFFKKILPIVTAAMLVFSLATTSVFAENTTESLSEEKIKLMIASGEILPTGEITEDNVKIKKEQAIRLAKVFIKKNLMKNTNEYEPRGIFLNPKWSLSGVTWSIDFYKSKSPGENVNIGIDANTGKVLYFNIWENYDNQKNHVATLTRAEAKVKAEEFLKDKCNIDLDLFELQRETPYYNEYQIGGVKEQIIYNFTYNKKINGIVLKGSNIYIGVDGTDGSIVSYSFNDFDVDMSKLPSAEEIVDAKQAKDKYMEFTDLSLQYISIYKDTYYGVVKPKIVLAYVPVSYISFIDAKTGNPVNYDGSAAVVTDNWNNQFAENPVPMDPDAKISDKVIDEKEAKALAQKYKTMVEELYGIKFDENSSSYYPMDYNAQDDIWSFNWYLYNENQNVSLSIAIKGKTGHINSLSIYNFNYKNDIMLKEGDVPAEITEKFNWSQCKEKALEIIKKMLPEQYGFYADQNLQEPTFDEETKKIMREYNYSFTRVVNGLYYPDNSIIVSIDRETGELMNLYFSWSDMEFPSASNIVEKEKALKKYFQGIEPTLEYLVPYTYDKVSGMEAYSDTPILVYTFSNPDYGYSNYLIDATSGKPVDWSGNELKAVDPESGANLPDHWAKRSVELLKAQKIIRNSDVDYDANLTRAEAVKMMVFAKGGVYYGIDPFSEQSYPDVTKDDENYFFVESAVKQKILTDISGEFNGNEKITKEEFVKLLANLLGYSDIAKYSNIYVLPAGITNISTDAKGSAAICYALGILPVKDGDSFDGSSKITWAEAASSLYKALPFIK
ncbi:MAG TPA: hypothetical protein GXX36_15260 [Clostridiaceae bacterium]|nr:hypothetical protein [Clostridiaceae bacterium]